MIPPGGSLSLVQRRALCSLASLSPAWTLTGGGALAGAWLGHRETRDLDLFFHGLSALGAATSGAVAALRATGLEVEIVRSEPTFAELRVHDDTGSVVVDLVAEPVPNVEPPRSVQIDGVAIRVDSPHEILVNKLCALLGRSELRDLVDVRALLDAGEDLRRAVEDAPKKDTGFSPLTLSWVLEHLPVARLAESAKVASDAAHALADFRSQLVSRLLALAGPETR